MNASERIRSLAIRHGIYLERYTKSQALEASKILEAAAEDVEKRLRAQPEGWTRQRYIQVLRDVKAIMSEATKSVESKLFDDLELLAEYETERAYKDFKGSLPVSLETTAPAPAQVMAAVNFNPASMGYTMTELTKKWEINTIDAFISRIRLGVAEGDTVNQLVQRVRGRVVHRATSTRPGVYEGGALQISTRGAETLARTAVAHVNATAREMIYQENDDIIKGYQWVATLDAVTCPTCGAYDGRVWTSDHPIPPNHPNCRCVIVPILKSFRELGLDIDEIALGTRASLDGQVPDKITYQDWLKTQDKETIQDILGIKRADLFIGGKTLDDMIDRTGQLISLARLRELDK